MKLLYSTPNFSVSKLFRCFFTNRSNERTIQYFQKYTEKKFILLTSSCRSALYLSYKALSKNGKVITSPLTCSVAVEPIVQSGNQLVFVDIDPQSFLMQTEKVEKEIDDETIAVQAIHLGGALCDMARLKQITRNKNICLVEDCAQGFSFHDHSEIGKHSDISCFSLAKNLYGIGGGILATNDEDIYNKAAAIQSAFPKQGLLLIISRITRNLLETFGNSFLSYLFQNILKRFKKARNSNHPEDSGNPEETRAFLKELVRPHPMLFRISYIQQKDWGRLGKIRENIGTSLDQQLQFLNLGFQIQGRESNKSYVKYFCKAPVDCRKLIPVLNRNHIEAKHLEAKFKKLYQTRYDHHPRYNHISILNCHNYLQIHDLLVSLPCREDFTDDDIKFLIGMIEKSIKELDQ